jgi:toxin ParE1/3/4
MRDVRLRPMAEHDLETIADYTIAQWSHDQARAYITELRIAIEGLAVSADRYPLTDLPFAGLRRMRCRHHLVYFLIADTHIDVVRVLHERMDASAWLGV